MNVRFAIRSLILVTLTVVATCSEMPDFEKMKKTDDLAVVVNANNPVQELTVAELRKIVNGERQFWSGKTQILLVLKSDDTPETQLLLGRTIHANGAEFNKIWTERVFRGDATKAPLRVPSSGMLVQVIRDYRGGIGFVAGHDLPPDLKIVKIEGKLPGEAKYFLARE
jgi:hypothetical protein